MSSWWIRCLLSILWLGFILIPANAQSLAKLDAETNYAGELLSQASIVMGYESPNEFVIREKGLPKRTFKTEDMALDALAATSGRDSIVVTIGKRVRYSQKDLKPLVDRLQAQLEKLGFSTIAIVLDSAGSIPLYRLVRK